MKKLILFWVYVLLVVPCGAAVITVDDDGPALFHSIQEAIDNANPNDVIQVAEGYYVEGTSPYSGNDRLCGLLFEEKNHITLNGARADKTTIDCNNVHYGLMLDDSHSITISGFTLRNSNAALVCIFNSSGTSGSNLIEYCVLDFRDRPADYNRIKNYHDMYYNHVTFVGPPDCNYFFSHTASPVAIAYVSDSIFWKSSYLVDSGDTDLDLYLDHTNIFEVDNENYTTGTYVTHADPNFVDPNNDDFRLAIDSPVRNVASDGTYMGALPPIMNCSHFVLADLNRDCKVDFKDFALLALYWLDCNLDPPELCLE